jgi:hypothetical protein
MKFSFGRPCIHRAFASSQRKHLDHAACRPLRSFSTRSDPVSAHRASGLGLVAQPSTPTVLWWTSANPADSVQPPRQSHSWLGRHIIPAGCWFCGVNQPNPVCRLWLWAATLHRFHLGFEAQPRNRTRLLAFLATMRPALDPVRPPGPSSRAYLSLHSSEATQSTPHCQWLITPRSDNPQVLGRSSPQ